MSRTIPFAKMHGCQNDYVVLDARVAPPDAPALARAVCARRTGVGADGLLLVGPSAVGDFRMRMFNVDGSESEMCGNGLRCAARFALERGLAGPGPDLAAETAAGILAVTAAPGDPRVVVEMGAPALPPAADTVETLALDGEPVEFTAVQLGNPHAVVFVDRVADAPVVRLGPRIETHPRFPHRTNVAFVEVVSPVEIRQRTWERGCGETTPAAPGLARPSSRGP